MTDQELLQLAVKAIGVKTFKFIEDVTDHDSPHWGEFALQLSHSAYTWNPLIDDGDALRLAVTLGIQVTPFLGGSCKVMTISGWTRTESGYVTCSAATRRAITRAAAEIGKAMP